MTSQLIEAEAIDASFVPVPRPHVASVVVDNEAVVYDEETGSIHLLNPTASMLWQCYDGVCSLGELIDDVSEAFELDVHTASRDVIEVARSIGRLGLLEGVAAAMNDDGQDHEGHDHA